MALSDETAVNKLDAGMIMEKNVIPSCLTFSKAHESIQAWPHIVQKEKSRLHGLLQSEAGWEDVFLMPYGFTCLFKPFSD